MTLRTELRRRVVDALDIGPLWIRRSIADGTPGPEPAPTTEALAAREQAIGRMSLEELEDSVRTCRACPLSRSRTHAVFGAGALRPRWLVVGRAPDAEEDAVGEPAVGRAGRLLDAMLAAVGHSRTSDTYVFGALRCRPEGDRAPTPEEIDRCRPYLKRQITLLAPEVVLGLGPTAQAALAGDPAATPTTFTHHPGDLLDSPERKREAWADLCRARTLEGGATRT